MLRTLIWLGGWLHLMLVVVNLGVPLVLDYRNEFAKLRPFIRKLFWTYGGFILLANLGFGVMTLAGVDDIVRGTRLGAAFTGFVAVYWGVRLIVGYAYFDWKDFPHTGPLKVARHLLDLLFVFLVAVYGYACVRGSLIRP